MKLGKMRPIHKMKFCVILLLVSVSASAQQIHEKINIDVVNIYVTARDPKGRFVSDLKAEDFTIKEDGVAQTLTHFRNSALEKSDKLGEKGVPLSVAILIDASASMNDNIQGHRKMDIVKNAAFRLVDELHEEDQMMLVSFSETPTEVTALTADKVRIGKDLLFQDVEGGNTSLWDSIYFAQQKIKDVWGRKIIVVCSDGEDTASSLKFDEVLSNIIASDVTVLAFGTVALNSSSYRGRYLLEKLAEASGGYSFFPTNISALEGIMQQLRQGLRSQYSLGYRPTKKMDGTWRKIEIVCRLPKLKLRYREGYFAE